MERFWVPLCILTVAGFTFNTSELIPIGLLSDIAGSFGVSEARAGMLITVYAWVVALMSLPLMLLLPGWSIAGSCLELWACSWSAI